MSTTAKTTCRKPGIGLGAIWAHHGRLPVKLGRVQVFAVAQCSDLRRHLSEFAERFWGDRQADLPHRYAEYQCYRLLIFSVFLLLCASARQGDAMGPLWL